MSFKSVQAKIAKQGHSMASAGAILANASRHASPAAKRANPKLRRVKGKMHDGGVIPESGLYEMQKGETVTPNHDNSDAYTQGSEGSRICKSNLRKYPLAETKPREEYSPDETDHPYGPPPSPYHAATDTEMIRRMSNRNRDHRHRFGVITAPISVDTNSDAEQYAENVSGRKD